MSVGSSGRGLRASEWLNSSRSLPGRVVPNIRLRSWRAIVATLFGVVAVLGTGCGENADPLAEARELLQRGRHRAAIARLREIVDEDPSRPDANLLLGRALMQAGEPALAVWPLGRAAESPEYAVEAGLLLSRATLRGRNTHDVVTAIDRVLAIEPDNVSALEIRMKVYLRASRSEEALADIDRILELDPENVEVLVPRVLALIGLKRIDEAGEALEKATLGMATAGEDASPEMQARLCAAKGLFTFEKGETEEAEVYYTECLEKFPSNQLMVSQTVRFYDQIGQRKRATEILRKTYEDTGTSAFRAALAQRMRGLNNHEEELRLLLEETEKNSTQNSWFQLGDYYARIEDYEAAVTAFALALAASEKPDPTVRFAYADVLIQSGQYEKARQEAAKFEQSVFRDLLTGRIHLLEGDPERALQSFEAGIRLWPNNPAARYLAGQAAEQLGDFERAVSEYREALRRNRKETEAALLLARIYSAQGIDSAALAMMGRFAKTHPTDPRAYLETALIAHRLGRHDLVAEGLTRLAQIPGQEAMAVATEATLLSTAKGPAMAVKAIERSKLDLTDPANSEALRVLLEQYEALGNSDALEKSIAAALAAHPDAAVFHELNAGVLRATGKSGSEVREAYERSIELEPEHFAGLIGLAEIEAKADHRAEAVALYDRAAAADEGDPAPAYAAALLLSGPETEEAVRRLEALLMSHPLHGPAANDLAVIFAERGDLDRALVLAQRADQFVAATEASETLGWIHLRRDESELAIAALTRAVERRPHAATARYRLGLAHIAKGDEASARKTLHEVIDAGAIPESDQALAEIARLDAAVNAE